MGSRQYCSIALVFGAACNFSSGTLAPDDGANVPDDGPRIDAPTNDAPMTDAVTQTDAAPDATIAPTDTDGDTIADTSDNCPSVANTNQRNHDGDPKGDACDRCPHLASTTDPDGDSDGVGDDCDPRPSTGGDAIALFEGFYDTTSINGWTSSGAGIWSVGSGVLSQTSTTASTTTNGLSPPLTVARAFVMSSATVISLGNGNSDFDAPHVSIAAGVTSNQSYWCSVVDDGNSDKVYASVLRPAMAPSFPNTAWSGTFTTGSQLQLQLSLLGSSNACTVRQGGTMANIAGTIGSASGAPQLATRTASASFDYLFVVSIGN
jgi:hypothetical protein